MKTIYLIFIAILFISTACSEEDKGQNEIKIDGTWEVKATWDPYPEDSNTNWFAVNSDVDYYHTITFQDGLFNFNLINQQGYECYGEYTFEYDTEINKYRLYLYSSECNLGIYGVLKYYGETSNSVKTINTVNLPNGLYFLNYYNGLEIIQMQLLIQH